MLKRPSRQQPSEPAVSKSDLHLARSLGCLTGNLVLNIASSRWGILVPFSVLVLGSIGSLLLLFLSFWPVEKWAFANKKRLKAQIKLHPVSSAMVGLVAVVAVLLTVAQGYKVVRRTNAMVSIEPAAHPALNGSKTPTGTVTIQGDCNAANVGDGNTVSTDCTKDSKQKKRDRE